MKLTIEKGVAPDIDVSVNSTSVSVTQGTSINVEVTPTARTEILLNKVNENLGTMAYQNADDVSISGGSVSGLTNLQTDYTQFDTTITPVQGVGKLQWDTDAGGLQVGMVGGNVNLQVGQETVVRVVNKTGATLTDGQVVYCTGASGQRLEVALALANADSTSATIMGVVTEPIANNQQGFITVQGTVNNIDTRGYSDGEILWLSPTVAGAFTKVKPVAPQHLVMVGYVVKGGSAGAGSIYIHVQNGYELDELHDVLITNKQNGDMLVYDSALSVWKNYTPTQVRTNLGIGNTVSASVATPSTHKMPITVNGTTYYILLTSA